MSNNVMWMTSQQTREHRIDYLERVAGMTLEALDQAANLGDFGPSISKLKTNRGILGEVMVRVSSIIDFRAVRSI